MKHKTYKNKRYRKRKTLKKHKSIIKKHMKGGNDNVEYMNKELFDSIKKNIIDNFKNNYSDTFEGIKKEDALFKKIYDIIKNDNDNMVNGANFKGPFNVSFKDPSDNLLHLAKININYNQTTNTFIISIIINKGNNIYSEPIIIWEMEDL